MLCVGRERGRARARRRELRPGCARCPQRAALRGPCERACVCVDPHRGDVGPAGPWCVGSRVGV